MEANRIDTIARLFASRRSRSQTLGQLATGLAAGALAATGESAGAQEATPAVPSATPAAATGTQYPKMLFLQSFQSGTVTAKAGETGHYTVTLAHGLGQTVYFSDRPERIVGAGPTEQFLKSFSFQQGNPPNAALVVETKPGVTDITVVELAAPVYDATGPTVTYEMKPLENWEQTLTFHFTEASKDLAKLTPTFGTASLFIDDCADYVVKCKSDDSNHPCPGSDAVCGQFGPMGYCYNWSQPGCWPCEPYDHLNPPAERVYEYWTNQCNNQIAACNNLGNGEDGPVNCYSCFGWSLEGGPC